jgi:hypothetical protein
MAPASLQMFLYCESAVIPMGHAVAQLVEALRYRPEGRGFDSRWLSFEFLIDVILSAALCPWG